MSSIKNLQVHRVLAYCVLAIGFSIGVGWLVQDRSLILWSFPFFPMLFNTSLLFCLLSLGTLYSDRDYFNIGRACSVVVFIFAGATFIQYPLGLDFGIDYFFVKPYIDTGMQFPGRMAASTAIAMMIAAIGLFFNKRTLICQYVRVTAAALLFGFGVVGLCGYVFDINSQYGWGSFAQMAISTAICFVLVSISLLGQLHRNLIQAGFSKKYYSQFVVLIVGLFVTLAFSQIILIKDYQKNKAITQIRAEALIEGFDNTFYPLEKALEHMSRRFAMDRYPQREVWEIDAESYVDDFIGLKRLTWVDKSMITRWAYPMTNSGSRVIGMNILEEPDVQETVKWVVKNKTPSLSRVIELKSGGRGFVMFVPILHGGNLIGMLSAAVRADIFFKRVVQAPGYFVSIRESDKTVMSTGTPNKVYAKDWSHQERYRTFNSSWDIVVTPSSEMIRANTSYVPAAVIFVGVLVSVLLSLALRFSSAARTSERKMKMALEWQEAGRNSVPLLMIQLDKEGAISSLNKAAIDLLEYTEDEIRGLPPTVYADPQEFSELRGKLEQELHKQVAPGKDFVEAIFAKGLNFGMERTLVSKSGRRLNVILSINRVRDEHGNLSGYLGVAEDITLRKERERLLKEQEEKIIVSSRLASLGEMAAGIAHEINNPLTIINGYISVLRKNLQQKGLGQDVEVNRRVDSIDSTVQRIAKIVKGLRSYAHGSHDGDMLQVSVDSIIDDTLAFCYDRFKNEGVKLVVRVEPGLMIRCRPHQISQVLLNLLNNSFDAVMGVENRHVLVEAQRAEHGVEISVTDSGPGVPFESREKIMQPFYTTKEVGKGVGLGLSISLGIMQAHGGKIYLDPRSPETRFVFWSPS